jgi:uncharacterized membrane protein YphA (DoxX/SURF4 family)
MPMSSQDSSRRLSWGVLLVRILVGWVFLSEGIQKFLFPAALGTGRFAAESHRQQSQFSAPFVGMAEIVCGTLVILGLFTSLAFRVSVEPHCLSNRHHQVSDAA